MRGTPQDMQMQTAYDNVADCVITNLKAKAEELDAAGVTQIILDPGFGFAKTLEQNYTLLGALPQLVALGYPVLVGVSRKSMIYKALETTPEDSLGGTIALNWECLRCGCKILRVHDTKQAVQTIKLFTTYEANR
jgi:dihydropteroate synthase